MKSSKCVECGFVGWADVPNCKACGAAMSQHAYTLPPPPAPVSPVSYHQYNEQWDVTESPKQGLAIFSLVLGVVGFFTIGLLVVGAITGTICGWIAMRRAKRDPRRYGGHGIAIAGFVLSLVTLVWIVPIGFAIAIPNLLASARAANEGAAISTVRQISVAQYEYQTKFGRYGTLDELAEQNLIEHRLATGTRSGYKFSMGFRRDENNLDGFVVTAVPLTSTSGTRSFYVDETLIVRAADKSGKPASRLDPPLGQDSDYPNSRSRRADYRPQSVY